MQISSRFSSCTADFFTAFDPPHVLAPASALLPAIPAGVPNPVPVPSPTQDPVVKDSAGGAGPSPLPPIVPTVDQPKATSKPDPISNLGTLDPSPGSDDSAAQETSPSQSHNGPEDPNTDPIQGSNPPQDPAPKEGTDPNQGSESGVDPEVPQNPGESNLRPHSSQQQQANWYGSRPSCTARPDADQPRRPN